MPKNSRSRTRGAGAQACDCKLDGCRFNSTWGNVIFSLHRFVNEAKHGVEYFESFQNSAESEERNVLTLGSQAV